MEEFNEAFSEINPSDKLKDRERKECRDSAGMCEVVRFRRCSWQVLCTRLLLDYGILFEQARYKEVARVTFEQCLSMWKGAMCCCLATLGYTGPSFGLHCKITLIWPDKALSLIPAAQA